MARRSRNTSLGIVVEPLAGVFRAGGAHVIPPRASARIFLYFRPTEGGVFTAECVLRTTDPDVPELVLQLTGKAKAKAP